MDVLILVFSAMLKLAYALAAVTVVWWTVRLVRRSTGRNMRAVLDTIDANPIAAAIYYAVTFLAVCFVVGHAIG